MPKQVDWVKLHNAFYEDDAVEALTDAAFRSYVESICLSDRLNTDGHLTKIKSSSLAKPAQRKELVSSDLWIDATDGGVDVPNFLKWQRSAEQKREAREAAAERQAAKRLGLSVEEFRQRNAGVTPPVTRDVQRDAGMSPGTELEGELELEVEAFESGNGKAVVPSTTEQAAEKPNPERALRLVQSLADSFKPVAEEMG